MVQGGGLRQGGVNEGGRWRFGKGDVWRVYVGGNQAGEAGRGL